MSDETLGVGGAESPTADPSEASAPATGGEQQPGSLRPERTVPFDRFQEVIAQRNLERQQYQQHTQQSQQLARAYQQLQGRLQQIEQRGQEAQIPQEHREAAQALLKIMEADPRLKQLLGLTQAMPHLARGYQQHDQMLKDQLTVQQQGIVSGGQQMLSEMVAKAGLPATDPKFMRRFENQVRTEIEEIPNGIARFKRGDLRVVREACDAVVKDYIGALRGSGALTATKNRLSTLPPAPRGGPAGVPAPKPIAPGKERDFERSMHERAAALLEKLQG